MDDGFNKDKSVLETIIDRINSTSFNEKQVLTVTSDKIIATNEIKVVTDNDPSGYSTIVIIDSYPTRTTEVTTVKFTNTNITPVFSEYQTTPKLKKPNPIPPGSGFYGTKRKKG